VEAEESVRIVPRSGAYQTVVVDAVVGVLPVLEVRVAPVRVHSTGPPQMHHPPRLLKPALCGLPVSDRRVGVDDYRVLEQEELVAMDEGGGLRRHAVVSAAPGREVQLARHSDLL
jgi:hypothetical protein